MSTRDIFNAYLQFRIERANALTPGKKLTLVMALLDEARQGRVPVGSDKVVQLPLESASVQAVLNGEPVSMGQARVTGRLSGASGILARAQSLPASQRGLLAAGIVFVFALVGLFGFVILTNDGQVEAAETVVTQVASATDEVEIILADSSPAKKPNDPASIQIGNTSFVLGRGKLKNGVWTPVQAEWLEGTEVRRVLAVPLDGLEHSIEHGDVLRVRTRSGLIVPYQVVSISNIQRTQIEIFTALEPSLVVVLYDQTAASTRKVVVAQLDSHTLGIPPSENAYLVNGTAGEINLRERPFGTIVGVLTNGTLVEIATDSEPVNNGGYTWVRVQTSYGAAGWVASQLLVALPDD